MTASIVSPPSRRADQVAGGHAERELRDALLTLGWPDRVAGGRLGRSLPAAARAAAQRAVHKRAAYAGLLFLLGLVSAVIGVAMTRPEGAAPDASAEKTLLAEVSSPNLNPASVEAPSRPTAPEPSPAAEITRPHGQSDPSPDPPAPALPLSPEPKALLEAEMAPPEVAPPPAELPQPVAPVPLPGEVVADDSQAPAVTLISTQPVESIMMRNWKALGYQAVLLAAFTATPGVAAPEDVGKDDKTPATAKDIREIKEILRTMDQAIGKDVQQMKKDIADLRRDVDALKQGNGTASLNSKEIEDLKQQILKLQQTIDAINKRLPQTSTSMRPSTPTTTGRLELVNDYPYQIEFVVNETAYSIAPGMTRVVNMPVGSTFTYRIPSLPGYQANRTRALDGDRPYIIRVYPIQ
jgi:hypothetical protein